MKSSKIMFTWLGLGIVALAITLSAVQTVAQLHSTTNEENPNDHFPLPKTEEPSYHQGRIGRFLADGPRAPARMTCDKYPTVCRARGSPGSDCCNKQCVNVMTDKGNCGKCGKRCSYSEMCCQGRCVNPSVDEYHCGRCNNACKKGSSCLYGLCSYAN
ncbi:hypothetical protein QUC31_013221 [Theobroma cacao]|uniref:Stigma-specific STIG1-like protein 1 n=2 Tax=Theobroma cacao TaxID=3641 RepID=A0AB32V2F8_THECC|nr:PREDICTED: stigma-specific STIG1-like protein 1 [Theobroma cacao]EOY28766.1 Stigma-specific Stig1 family protein, putative [Theobroma cacao]